MITCNSFWFFLMSKRFFGSFYFVVDYILPPGCQYPHPPPHSVAIINIMKKTPLTPFAPGPHFMIST